MTIRQRRGRWATTPRQLAARFDRRVAVRAYHDLFVRVGQLARAA